MDVIKPRILVVDRPEFAGALTNNINLIGHQAFVMRIEDISYGGFHDTISAFYYLDRAALGQYSVVISTLAHYGTGQSLFQMRANEALLIGLSVLITTTQIFPADYVTRTFPKHTNPAKLRLCSKDRVLLELEEMISTNLV
jgi:hypothetical protein